MLATAFLTCRRRVLLEFRNREMNREDGLAFLALVFIVRQGATSSYAEYSTPQIPLCRAAAATKS